MSTAATQPIPFENFDEDGPFAKFEKAVGSEDSLNFVLKFNRQKATCAFNLSDDQINTVLTEREEWEVRSLSSSCII